MIGKDIQTHNLTSNSKEQVERCATMTMINTRTTLNSQNSLSSKLSQISNKSIKNKRQNEITVKAAPDNLKTTYTSIHEKSKNKLKNKIELRLSLNEATATSIIKRTGISTTSGIPRPPSKKIKKQGSIKLNNQIKSSNIKLPIINSKSFI